MAEGPWRRWGRAVGTRWLSPLLQRPRATVASQVPAQRLIGHSHGVSGCHCYMLAVERARAILCQHRHSIALSLSPCVICLAVVATRTLRLSSSLSRLVSHLSYLSGPSPPVFQVSPVCLQFHTSTETLLLARSFSPLCCFGRSPPPDNISACENVFQIFARSKR